MVCAHCAVAQVLKTAFTPRCMRLFVGHGGPVFVWQEEISCCAYYLEQLFQVKLTLAQTRMCCACDTHWRVHTASPDQARSVIISRCSVTDFRRGEFHKTHKSDNRYFGIRYSLRGLAAYMQTIVSKPHSLQPMHVRRPRRAKAQCG